LLNILLPLDVFHVQQCWKLMIVESIQELMDKF